MPKRKKKQGRPKRQSGRPTEITPELQAQLESLISDGNSYSKSCEATGTEIRTFGKWMEKGAIETDDVQARTQVDGSVVPLIRLTIYRQFRRAILRARAVGNASLLRKINNAADTDWRAAAWVLERVNPDDFQLRDKMDLNVKGSIEHKAIVVHMPAALASPRIKPISPRDEPLQIEPPKP